MKLFVLLTLGAHCPTVSKIGYLSAKSSSSKYKADVACHRCAWEVSADRKTAISQIHLEVTYCTLAADRKKSTLPRWTL